VAISLQDKVVVVTGAGMGIGAALARGFAGAGAQVAAHYHRSAEGAQAVAAEVQAAGGRVTLLQADLTDRTAVTGLFDTISETLGGVDVLVNNTGGLVRRALVDEAPDDLYDAVLEVNFGSVFAACRAAVPSMKARGGGAIINITSIAARNGGGRGASLYCAGKGAVSSYTRALAKELASDNIRVNAISPGVIDTPFHSQTAPEAFAAMVSQIPLGRPGRPDEIIGPALFLADDSLSSFVTGHVLEVNGGHVMG
jgi:3-oxoacyl-[acyl-carrier protein] reductase